MLRRHRQLRPVLFANDNGVAPAAAGDEYRLLRPEGVTGTTVGPAPELGCLGTTPFIDLGVTANSWPYDFPIGVSGTWDLFPQAVEVLATENQTYKDIPIDPYGATLVMPSSASTIRIRNSFRCCESISKAMASTRSLSSPSGSKPVDWPERKPATTASSISER